MTYYCESDCGESMHLNAPTASFAAEAFVEELARAGMVREGATTYVRVTYSQCTSPEVSYFEVEVEMVPDATAKPCDGDGLVFDG